MRTPALALLLAALCMAEASAAPAAPAYECRWADQPLTIDGSASETAWQQAQPLSGFVIPASSAKPEAGTTARLLWDRENLYFYAEMEDKQLYSSTTEPEGKLWEGDVFELFFKPAGDKPGYYEFEVNPANATLSLFFPARDAGGYPKFKGRHPFKVKTAVRRTDKGWAVEGALRWNDFAPTGGRPNPDETWSFALCRGDASSATAPVELSSSAPLTKVSFHRYEDYSPIRFVGPTATTARPFGIANRTAWTRSRVIGSPDAPPPYTVEKAFPKLHIRQPIYAVQEPGTDSLFVIQHLGNWAGPGRILRLRNDPNVDSVQTVLDLDWIIYGMCFHPKYAENHWIYLISNGPVPVDAKVDRISRFAVDPVTHKIDPKSELVILEWASNGHNGGEVHFGPDGYLWCPAGDGTSDSDGNLRGQDLTHLTSTMIRIDVDHPDNGKPYSIPKDNPFLHIPGARPEAYAFGFRNPWRMCFDPTDGTCFVGNNGQDLWEQVYIVRRGDNFGWSITEGSHDFYPNRKQGPAPLVKPAIEHPHSEFRSLTGGIVYYGAKFPELQGKYIYGDFSTGRIRAAGHQGDRITSDQEIARTTIQIVNFSTDSAGNIFICDEGGEIHRLIPNPPPAANAQRFPQRLSETGLFVSTRDHQPDPALIPYDVNSPLWSDGALKDRFIALPGDSQIGWTSNRGWNFPEGAVLVKTFSLPTPSGVRRIETRLLTRQLGQWAGYSYIWSEDQSDAKLVEREGKDVNYTVAEAQGNRPLTWHYPSRTECMVCHSRAANFVLGPCDLQMNKEHDYGGVRDNQLRVLEHLGVLKVDYAGELWRAVDPLKPRPDQRQASASTLLPKSPEQLGRLVNPYDSTQDLSARARSYLHANCAICHVEAGGGNAAIDLEFTTPRDRMRLFDIPPNHHTFNLPEAKIIASGRPDSSTLLHRISMRGPSQMPPLASSRIDPEAVKLIRDWIASLKPDDSAK